MNNTFGKRFFYIFSLHILFGIFCTSTDLNAQDKQWSLRRCLVYAIDNSLDVQQSQFNIETAAINTLQSKNQRYPNFSVGSSLGLNFGRTVDPTTNSFRSVNFLSNGFQLNSAVLIYNGRRLVNTIKSNQTREQATREDLNSVMVTLAFDIAQYYFSALLAQENVARIRLRCSYRNHPVF